jgi:hypothetical protein
MFYDVKKNYITLMNNPLIVPAFTARLPLNVLLGHYNKYPQ